MIHTWSDDIERRDGCVRINSRGRRYLVGFTFGVVGLEADLEDAIAEGVAIEGLNGYNSLIVVGHGDKAEALALVCLQILNHLNTLDGTEGAKQLPQYILLRFRCQIVHKDAPAGTIDGIGGENGVAQEITS